MGEDVRKIRPRLSTISPITHWISIGFAWLNFWLAQNLFFTKSANLVIYHGLLSQKFWALVFLLLGCTIAFGLFTNRWEWVRHTMIAGLLVKLIFLYAIVVLGKQIGFAKIEGTLALWLFLVWAQMGCVMFFLPPVPTRHGNDR